MDSYEKSLQTLELPAVLALLAAQAVSETARAQAMALRPSGDRAVVATRLGETSAAASMMVVKRGSPSFSGVKDVRAALQRAGHGRRAQHARAAGHRGCTAGGALRAQLRYRRAAGQDEHRLSLQRPAGQPLPGGEDLHLHHRRGRDRRQRVERVGVHPPADPRRERARVHDALQKIISSPSYAKALQEPIITMRSERYVVPVKASTRAPCPASCTTCRPPARRCSSSRWPP